MGEGGGEAERVGGTDGIEKMRDKRTSIGRTLTPPYLTGTHKYIYKRYTSM